MKKLIAITAFFIVVLAGCNLLGPLVNPVIGTWEISALGITNTSVFNADGTSSETTTILGVGVVKTGTWSSADSILTTSWSDSSEGSDFYTFNSDNSTMTLVATSGGLSRTLTRQ
ncbi:MAG: hypothetical protein NT061_08980 [Spirochaetes bacterium]|nr:hypothetical protein [Spirochaetota bacterium]